MFDHVHRTVIVGTAIASNGDASESLETRVRPAGLERYTGLVVFLPKLHLAVLEGPAPLHTLHRHALSLAGLAAAHTLLMQRTTFRWFSALIFQQHATAPHGFTMAELAELAMLPPRRLCNHIAGLALLSEPQVLPSFVAPVSAARIN
jgi:hypothetical protein